MTDFSYKDIKIITRDKNLELEEYKKQKEKLEEEIFEVNNKIDDLQALGRIKLKLKKDIENKISALETFGKTLKDSKEAVEDKIFGLPLQIPVLDEYMNLTTKALEPTPVFDVREYTEMQDMNEPIK